MAEVRFLLPYQARTRGRRVFSGFRRSRPRGLPLGHIGEQPCSHSGRGSGLPWRGLAVAILATTLGLSVWGCRATGQRATAGPATPQSSPRATADCPDDGDLPQIHLLYAIPSDGTDLELDKNGLIRASVASAQSWLAKESGGSRLRFDTSQGDLDVTFVRLPRTEQEYSAFGEDVPEQVEYDLWSAGFSAPNKIYAAYYGGSLEKCGQAPHPLDLPGNVVVLAPWTPYCPEPFPVPSPPADWEFTLVHEVFHALGAVSREAPNHCFAKDCAPGHVRKPRRDLMSAPKWKFPSRLDVGKDDYWGHSKVGLVDVSRSAFLDPTPTNYALPPIWPPSVATAIPASQEPTLRSPSTSEKVKLQIVNRSGSVLHVHWLNHSGAREPYERIPVDSAILLETLQGHLWVVADDQGKALAIYRAPDKGWGRAIHVAP